MMIALHLTHLRLVWYHGCSEHDVSQRPVGHRGHKGSTALGTCLGLHLLGAVLADCVTASQRHRFLHTLNVVSLKAHKALKRGRHRGDTSRD